MGNSYSFEKVLEEDVKQLPTLEPPTKEMTSSSSNRTGSTLCEMAAKHRRSISEPLIKLMSSSSINGTVGAALSKIKRNDKKQQKRRKRRQKKSCFPIERDDRHFPSTSKSRVGEERKRMLSDCRLMRHKIDMFEEMFFKIHRHLPKGPERIPIAAIYLQYNDTKRKIRYQAAVQIQSLCRGARARDEVKAINSLRKLPLHIKHNLFVSDSLLASESIPLEIDEVCDEKQDIDDLMLEIKCLREILLAYEEGFYAAHGRQMSQSSDFIPAISLYRRYNEIKDILADPSRVERGETKWQIDNMSTVESLCIEKFNLHQVLDAYEKAFLKFHQREVSSYSDIKPLAVLYKRYRDIEMTMNRAIVKAA